MININLLEDLGQYKSEVIFLEEKGIKTIDVNEETRKELLIIDKYIEYSSNMKSYTIYRINDRAVDINNNLLLFGEMEYLNE